MRIGLFTDAYFPIIGGVSVSVRTLRDELEKLGHEVFIITNNHDDALKEKNVVRAGGHKLPMKAMGEFRVGKVTKAKVKEISGLKLDIVHCHTEFTMGRLGRKVAKKNHIPIVHTYHTMYEDYIHFITKIFARPLRAISKRFSRNFANSVDEVVFPTIKVKKTFDEYGYKKSSHIIPTGIYLEKFSRSNVKQYDLIQLKEKLGLRHDDFVMLFLGRISREKSIEELIREFSKIKKEKVKLLIVGGGPDEDYFKKIVVDLGLQGKVIFTGMIEPTEIAKYYHLGNLFVNFSVTETQGLTYYEALASCVPLVVKYDDNLEDVIIEGVNGFSFTHNNEFSKICDKVVSDNLLHKKLVSNSCSSVEKFSAVNYAKSIEAIYNKLYNK